ncbi:MAG: Asp-tRNA(Asn)/Glu-tRNA(Gln) amidotransferase subunit GatA [Pseudomonadota bacterium]|nr:Asp-tRNA(Asn)/Glu-tRNA(Gln) amidotransferase subunit GatA [Pseudomonadota bacterium]
MMILTDLTIAEARNLLIAGDISSVELTEAHIRAMEATSSLNLFITETCEQALSKAEKSDTQRLSGNQGKLEGIPIAVKDLFCTHGVLASAASKMLTGYTPCYESTVTKHLWNAGAVMLGKTNMDEFAMGSSNETSYYGPVTNPWQRVNEPTVKLVPGGSSGGSAAAVAARAVMGALGTDTGGSIRQPASFCGVVGIKPTYGRCSRWGMIAFASSLDQAGPLTRTVRDSAIMLGEMAGYDAKDSTSVNIEVPDYEAALKKNVKGVRVGVPQEYFLEGMPKEIQCIWDKGITWFKEAGAEVKDVSLPHTKYALPTYYIVAPAEASSNLARYDGVRYGLRIEGKDLQEMYENTRAEGFGREVRRRIMIGTYVLSAGYYDAYYLKAQKVRTKIADDFRNSWKSVDLLLTPTAPSAAFVQGEKINDPIAMYLNDIFTVPASMAGLPAISVPVGLSSEGLPLGLQLIAKPFDEELLFRGAGLLELAANFKEKPKLAA